MTGIGLLNEKPLHASLKQWYARPGDRFEVPVDGFVIDIVRRRENEGSEEDLLIESRRVILQQSIRNCGGSPAHIRYDSFIPSSKRNGSFDQQHLTQHQLSQQELIRQRLSVEIFQRRDAEFAEALSVQVFDASRRREGDWRISSGNW